MDNQDSKRLFGNKEKDALFLAADGKSELSGEPLEKGWHADHAMPWFRGGPTDISNAQALTAKENLKKGSKVETKPREWQKNFFDKYHKHPHPDFFLAALPAAGKTFASLYLANEFLTQRPNRRLIIVTPTRHIRDQWKKKAHQVFGIELQSREFKGTLRTNVMLKDGFQGITTTYSTILNNSMLFRRFCAQYEVFFIFDEIHHAKEGNQYGRAIQEAAENAARRLLLTGTPFRTDGCKIPFVKLDPDGQIQIDERYDYPQALRDGVIRELVFKRYVGWAEYRLGEDKVEHHSRDEHTEDEWRSIHRAFLRTDKFMMNMYRDANFQLEEIRRRVPNAGGLIVCEDIDKARHQLRLLKKVTGETAILVASDDPDSSEKIEGFRKNNQKWIIAVRMISEGVDVPRLMVLVYATHWTTDLCFRQIIGRVMRYQGTEEDTEAYVYAPDVEPIRTYMTEIEQFQEQVARERVTRQRLLDDREPATPRYFEVIDAENEYIEITSRGEHFDAAASRLSQEIASKHGIAEAKAAAIFQEYIQPQQTPTDYTTKPVRPSREEKPKEDRLKDLRISCSKKVRRLIRNRYGEHADQQDYQRVIGEFQGWVTFKDRGETDLQEFEKWLIRRLN